ncbi:MAG: DNA polymerase I [Candidatus Hatepunaea meridiana]|nr:DNA polymerase I [Candidatus Hatepunaea meridiana]
MPNLFLIDGTALVFRSFHAFSGRAQLTSRGRNVGLVYGFLATLLMICRKENPDLLAISFDTGAPTFRHKMFKEYKAKRPPVDEELLKQLPLLYEILDELNIPTISLDGWEADDVIGTLAKRAEKAGLDVFMVTADKDFYQLVSDKVKVYTLPRKTYNDIKIYDPSRVEDKFGVPPERVIDVLGLMGDTSDNVPGIPKVGPKTAVDLIKRFGSFENVLNSARLVKQPKLRENLKTFADQARLSYKLVTIDTDTPVSVNPETFTYGPLNNPDSRDKLIDLEFLSIIKQLDKIEPENAQSEPTENIERQYHSITDPEGLLQLVHKLEKADLISMDTETTSVNAMQAELVGLSFAIEEGEAWYVAVNYFKDIPEEYKQPALPHLRPNTSRELTYILDQLKPLLTEENLPKTGQNLKYDVLVLRCYDIDIKGIAFDTMIASHLLDSSARQHNLDLLAQLHLNIRKIPISNLIGKGSKQISMADVDIEEIYRYACEDADVTLRLHNFFHPTIKENNFSKLLQEQELPLIPVLTGMEQTGVKLDTDLLSKMSTEFQSEIEQLELDVHELAGQPFNLNSTQQLADILYNKLGLPSGKKTKSGFSTNIAELERLAPVHELPRKLLRYRHLAKLKSTYIDALPALIHPITGRVHTSYTLTVAATGRLSSTDPNLQNIPIRSEEGGRIRKAFIAGEPGWKIVSADYSQIELRIMAHLSGDERLIEAFNLGYDIHRSTAAWMADIPPELITSDMRRQAKEVNFGVLYGMGDFGLAQRLGISRRRAKAFIEQYFTNFPRVKEYIEEVHQFARDNGYVETMMGRRRQLPDINARNFQIRQNAQRIAINTPIQGSAADLMKRAMIGVYQMLKNEQYLARMLMQVHDELVFEAPEDEVTRLTQKLKDVMGSAMELKVPLEIGISWGDNWLDAHE